MNTGHDFNEHFLFIVIVIRYEYNQQLCQTSNENLIFMLKTFSFIGIEFHLFYSILLIQRIFESDIPKQ